MPTYVIEGKKIRTDSALTDDEIDEIAAAFKNTAKQKITPQEYDDAWAANFLGAGFGVGDELLAGARAANRFISGIGDLGSQDAKQPGSFSSDYTKELGQVRQSQEKLADYSPEGSFMGQLAGGLPFALLTGGPVSSAVSSVLPKVGTVGNAAITGAGFGGVAGFGSGEGGLESRLKSGVVGATVGAITGAGTEKYIAPALGRVVEAVRGRPGLFDANTNKLTPAGRTLAERAGVNPDEVSAAYQAEFAKQARDAVDVSAAARLAQSRSLPVPVPTTKGQATLDPEQQMFESLAAEGSFGPQAGSVMRQQREATQGALQENARVIQNRMGGGSVDEFGQGVDIVRQTLINQEQALRARTNQLYQAARENNAEAFVLGNNVADSLAGIRQTLIKDGFSEINAGRVYQTLNKAADDLLAVTQQVGKNPNVSVGNIFDLRAQLAALSRSTDAIEGTAAGAAQRQLDKFLDDAVTQDLISGDPAVAELWRRAISSRRERAQQFPKGSLAQKLVERTKEGYGLKLDYNGANNLIFGSSTTGWASRSGIVDGLKQVKALLKNNPHEWNSLREEAFMRIVRDAQSTNQAGAVQLSGQKFKTAWEKMLEKSPEVVRVMFSKEEIDLINQFSSVAHRVTTTVPGGRAFSGTPQGLSLIAKKIISFLGGNKVSAALQGLPIVEGAANAVNLSRVNAAASGAIPRGRTPPPPVRIPGAVTALGGMAAANEVSR